MTVHVFYATLNRYKSKQDMCIQALETAVLGLGAESQAEAKAARSQAERELWGTMVEEFLAGAEGIAEDTRLQSLAFFLNTQKHSGLGSGGGNCRAYIHVCAATDLEVALRYSFLSTDR